MIDHREMFPGGEVVYWKDNTACGKLDAWTTADVTCAGNALQFTREQEYKMKSTIRIMKASHEAGRQDYRRGLLRFLGLKP